jgi:hypothetical protein
MIALLGLLFWAVQPFWEARPPERWTDREVDTILHASPWAEPLGPTPEVLVYFATAAPIEDAERELRLRGRKPQPEPDPDYTSFVNENRERAFVLAIPYRSPVRFGTAEEQTRMENECEMVVDRKTYPILGHFPPTTGDPVLRLVFPRRVEVDKKSVVFRLFLPGVPFPEREIEFRPRDLVYHGKLEI